MSNRNSVAQTPIRPVRLLRIVFLNAAVLGLALVSGPALIADAAATLEQARITQTAKLHETLDVITRAVLKSSPETATALAITKEEAGGKFSDRLSVRSEAEAIRTRKVMKQWLTRLDKVDATVLND